MYLIRAWVLPYTICKFFVFVFRNSYISEGQAFNISLNFSLQHPVLNFSVYSANHMKRESNNIGCFYLNIERVTSKRPLTSFRFNLTLLFTWRNFIFRVNPFRINWRNCEYFSLKLQVSIITISLSNTS